jgi:hypothetical protein
MTQNKYVLESLHLAASGFLETNLECVINYVQCEMLFRSDQSAACLVEKLPLERRHEGSEGPYQSARQIATSEPAPTRIRTTTHCKLQAATKFRA